MLAISEKVRPAATGSLAAAAVAVASAKSCKVGKRVLQEKLNKLSGELTAGKVARLAARLNARGKACLAAASSEEIVVEVEVKQKRRGQPNLLSRFRKSTVWRR